MKIGIVFVLCSLFMGTSVAGALAEIVTADEIVKKTNHMSLYQGLDSKGKVMLEITDRQGRVRKRNFNMLRLDCDKQDENQKYFVFFQAPADVRKMVFMVHKHAALNQDDDRWMYMPSLDLVKRIASSDKRTSFVGSDFLYEDISGRSPHEDIHELIKTTDSSYIIKNTPIKFDEVEFAYFVAHIDKKTFLPIKIEFFKKGDRPYRVIESIKLENIQGMENGTMVSYPTITVSIAKDLENRSETKMIVSDIQYNNGLSEKLFTERYLRRPPRDAIR